MGKWAQLFVYKILDTSFQAQLFVSDALIFWADMTFKIMICPLPMMMFCLFCFLFISPFVTGKQRNLFQTHYIKAQIQSMNSWNNLWLCLWRYPMEWAHTDSFLYNLLIKCNNTIIISLLFTVFLCIWTVAYVLVGCCPALSAAISSWPSVAAAVTAALQAWKYSEQVDWIAKAHWSDCSAFPCMFLRFIRALLS